MTSSLWATPQAALDSELAFEGWLEEVKPLISSNGSLASFANYVDHDVLGFRLEYSTSYRGEEVTVSGLVVLPVASEEPAPILVWTHGTIFDESAAPSSWRGPVHPQLIPALNGMITFLPDYIGYGSSAKIIHPYLMRDELVASVIDMIPAGRELLEEEGIPFSDELYVCGFSEGGYVALATASELDNNPLPGLALTQVHAISGPYSMLHASTLILSDPSYPTPGYVAFLFAAYNDRYWQRPATDFFSQPHAKMVTRYQARKSGLRDLVESVPGNLGRLLSPAFAERFAGKGETDMKASLAENDVQPWAPRMPVVLYHGTADRDVPFPIGQQQHKSMLEAGADPKHLSFVAYEGADHSATLFKALRAFLER